MKDILDMSIPQLEMLIEGIGKNSKRTQDAMENVESGNAQDLLAYLHSNGGEI